MFPSRFGRIERFSEVAESVTNRAITQVGMSHGNVFGLGIWDERWSVTTLRHKMLIFFRFKLLDTTSLPVKVVRHTQGKDP